jgi:outer membrane receptor protein involved in Fe transport
MTFRTAAIRRDLRQRALSGCAVLALSAGGAFAEDDGKIRLDLPEQALSRSLTEVGREAGLEIGFTPDTIAARTAPALEGEYAPEQALALLLADSNMVARRTDAGAIVVESEAASRSRPLQLAQTQTEAGAAPPSSAPVQTPAEAAAPAEADRITVTGSRIVRSGMTTPTPVTAVTADELTTLAPTTLMDALNQLPQFTNSSTPQTVGSGWTGSAGQSILNLRGIGSNRTLVLLDGRRVVSSNRRGTVDIGILPEALVERVEVVTGGASAAYGSDAVAGVVNFILDTDYEGVKGHLQGGVSDHGDNENLEASLSGGFQLGQRAHVLLSIDAYRSDGVDNYLERDWYKEGWGVINNPSGDPDRVIAPDVHSRNWTFGGVIPRGPLANTQFLEGGVPAPFVVGDYASTTTQSGGSGEIGGLDRTMAPKNDRMSAFGHFTYDLTDSVELFAQYLFGYNKVEYDNGRNNMTTPWEARVYADNAFLPESVRQAMLAGSPTAWAAYTTPATDPVAPGLRWVPFGRQAGSNDLSRSVVETFNQTHSFTGGLNAAVQDWDVNAYYQYGENRQKLAQRDLPRVDRAFRAMDAVVDPASGRIVCRSTLSNPGDGCIPTSFFGDGAVNEEAYRWIVGDRIMYQELDQHFVEASASGELFDAWAGPVSLAVGASYREDSINQYAEPVGVSSNEPGCTPNDETQGYVGLPNTYENCYGIFERGSIALVQGGFNVWETFAETVVPLLRDAPFAQSIDFQGGVRYADYSGSGGVVAWKTGLDWQVDDELRLRGTLSRDTRAGTLAERFDQTRRGATAEDPLFDFESYAFSGIEGGDAAIDPEKADTLTVGFVYQPGWLDGLSLSVDYYDIKIDGAIALLGVQNIIDQCFEGVTELCSRIVRDPVSNRITEVLNTYLNADEARTRGVDMEAAYRTPLDLFSPGNLTLRGILSYVDEASTTVAGGVPEDLAGQNGPGGVPDWRATLSAGYATGPWSFNVTGRYIDGGNYDNEWESGVDISDNHVASMFYTNVQVTYALTAGGGEHELFFSVNNLTNEEPDRSPGSAQFNNSIYEEIGRTYTAGLRFSF